MLAFDTGPGNCICDMLMRPEADFDDGGKGAAGGKLIQRVLDRALANAWFADRPPKSTDGPAMIEAFQEAMEEERGYSRNDLLRTACELSARTIANAFRQLGPPVPDELIASGGGVHNATLMKMLREALGGITILTTGDLGVPSAAKEAIAFALLGAATLDGEAGNVPSCTGAKEAVVLGSITPRPMQ
jgi:anhydro-N-acetylmuramic acid kinase